MAKIENNIVPSVSVTFVPVSTHFTAVKSVYKTAEDEEAVTVGKIVVNVPKLSGEFEVQNEIQHPQKTNL